ncbi:hypothetical protein SteCoe_18972 [Stentor coeruleus]|uniref:RING-type domain-containing protein n=1 Tax=Stentor coeruleus TaxID=5963 RepID=A0A1R2BVK1_9CILI|nr:hypothetical protein SteCoe_18972 [Stentor coeruleus]
MDVNFECPICFEIFTSDIKPLVVPCGHTVCTPCIKSLIKSTNFECPVCRVLHNNITLNSLSPNYALIKSSKPNNPNNSQLWERIEEVHKCLLTLHNFDKEIEENTGKFRGCLNKAKADAQKKYDMLINSIKNIATAVVGSLEVEEREIEAKIDRIKRNIKNEIGQKNELMGLLQASYSSNTDPPARAKLALSTLEVPKIDTSLPVLVLKGENFDVIEKIKQWFGNLATEVVVEIGQKEILAKDHNVYIENKDLNDRKQESPIIADKKNKEKGPKGRHGNKKSKKALKKQPDETNLWYVKNRAGKWEKLAPWFETQIKVASDRGENEFLIYKNNNPRFMINLQENMSYKLKKNGDLGRANEIRFQPDL